MVEIGGFLALAGLMIGLFAWLRQDVRGEIDGLRGEINGLRQEIGDLRERMARLEGLLEGLREAIGGRHAA